MLNSIADETLNLWRGRGRTKPSSSGWISGNAVCCTHNGETADTRGRGGFITKDGAITYSCFNCNFKASFVPGRHLSYKFRKLLSWLGADEGTVKRMVIEAVRIKDLVEPDRVIEAEQVEPITFRPRSLPDQAQSFQALNTFYELNDSEQVPREWHDAVIYAANRQVDLFKYDFYWTPERQNNLHRRIIIPFTWRGDIIGYTARGIYDEVRPKYLDNHEGSYVFNVDRQRADSKFVIVCEGPFDAMCIDGVAILGNECNEQQADIIDSLTREVIVVPDADRAGARLIDAAMEYGWSVSFPIWLKDCKDTAMAVEKYGKLFTIKSILAARQSSRLKIELYRKKLYN